MSRSFNVTGACNPRYHYMVNIDQRLKDIKELIDQGNYFTINRARQYGKTTTLGALAEYLRKDYIVVYLDFQMLSYEDFVNETVFVATFMRELMIEISNDARVSKEILDQFMPFTDDSNEFLRLSTLFPKLSKWCAISDHPIVLMIDEVDSASNNQVFLDFLAQLRGYFNARMTRGRATFLSVILAGVYDIKDLKMKIEPETKHKYNSPWNIATDFLLDMRLSKQGIKGMLNDYELEHHTGMDTDVMAKLIYDYTSGYPYLVSKICKLIDERIVGEKHDLNKSQAWTKAGFLEAVKLLLLEKNSLFESLFIKLADYPDLNKMLRELLFKGKEIPYTVGVQATESAKMFGFVKISENVVVIENRIFEILLYNLFLTSPELQDSDIYKAALQDKNQFIQFGHLNMDLVLEKFVVHFHDLYGDQSETFLEEDGRRYFLLYLRPIINGTGNYYIEAQTRNMKRTDVIVDYHGKQYVIELKIWHGSEYNNRGEKQLTNYLEYYHLKKGYMLSFNFNKDKQIGVRQIYLDDKVLIEAVV